MLWVPQKGKLLVQHNVGTVGDSTPGTTITTGAASSTKGTAVELLTTTFDAYWISIYAFGYGTTATNSSGCLDILTGAATEEILIPDLLMGCCGLFSSTAPGPKQWHFPLYIPSGTRLAARAAGQRVSTAFTVAIYLYGGHGIPPFRVGSHVTTYGVTVPVGTTVVPGASAAEGAWAQITASTSEDHFAFMPSFQPGDDTTKGIVAYFLDIGVGAATEDEIAQSYMYCIGSDERMMGPFHAMPVFQDVPAGTRMVMRVSNSGANDAGNYNCALHAVS